MRFILPLVIASVASAEHFPATLQLHETHFDGDRLHSGAELFHRDAHKHMYQQWNPLKTDDKEVCKHCVMGGARWIMHMISAKIDAFCDGKTDEAKQCAADPESPRCSKKHYWCKFWQEKPKVALGFMAEKVRPLSLAFAYCKGKGPCGEENEAKDVVLKEDAEKLDFPLESMGEEFEELDLSNMLENGVLDEHDMKRDAESDSDSDSDSESDSDEEDHHPHGFFGLVKRFFGFHQHHHHERPHHGKELSEKDQMWVPKVKGICVHCYIKVFRAVMRMAVHGAKHVCESTECPFLQKWCKWAGDHPEMAYGMLLAKVEPWKFAIGRCWGPDHHKGKGKGKGHHHHHKGKGKGKGDDKGKGKGKGDDKGKGKGKDGKGKGKDHELPVPPPTIMEKPFMHPTEPSVVNTVERDGNGWHTETTEGNINGWHVKSVTSTFHATGAEMPHSESQPEPLSKFAPAPEVVQAAQKGAEEPTKVEYWL